MTPHGLKYVPFQFVLNYPNIASVFFFPLQYVVKVKEGIKEQLKRVKDKYIAPLKEKSSKEPNEKDQKHREVDQGQKDQEKTEPRKKKDDEPKEITKRTTSGRISSDKKTDKKADKQ